MHVNKLEFKRNCSLEYYVSHELLWENKTYNLKLKQTFRTNSMKGYNVFRSLTYSSSITLLIVKLY